MPEATHQICQRPPNAFSDRLLPYASHNKAHPANRGLLLVTALLLALICASATASEGPMTFEWMEPPTSCRVDCRPLVVASGPIMESTPGDFREFSASHDVTKATFIIESDGGSVRGALALGRALRRAGVPAASVGRATGTGEARHIEPDAACESMCVFVLYGAPVRHIPNEASVQVHQIWLGDRRDDPLAATYRAADLSLVQRDVGAIIAYLSEMSVGTKILELAMRIPPWEPLLQLSREDLRAAGLEPLPVATGNSIVAGSGDHPAGALAAPISDR